MFAVRRSCWFCRTLANPGPADVCNSTRDTSKYSTCTVEYTEYDIDSIYMYMYVCIYLLSTIHVATCIKMVIPGRVSHTYTE